MSTPVFDPSLFLDDRDMIGTRIVDELIDLRAYEPRFVRSVVSTQCPDRRWTTLFLHISIGGRKQNVPITVSKSTAGITMFADPAHSKLWARNAEPFYAQMLFRSLLSQGLSNALYAQLDPYQFSDLFDEAVPDRVIFELQRLGKQGFRRWQELLDKASLNQAVRAVMNALESQNHHVPWNQVEVLF